MKKNNFNGKISVAFGKRKIIINFNKNRYAIIYLKENTDELEKLENNLNQILI